MREWYFGVQYVSGQGIMFLQLPYKHDQFGKKKVNFWGAETCDKYKASLPKVDENHMLHTCPKLQH